MQSVVSIHDKLLRIGHMNDTEIHYMQLDKLKKIVTYHYNNNQEYHRMMKEKSVAPYDIKNLEDITKLPIVEPKQLSQDIYCNFCSMPQNKIAGYLETSGSTGKPKIIPVGCEEEKYIFEQVALMWHVTGIGSSERMNGRSVRPIYSMFPFGPWPSQYFSVHGAELLGPTIKSGIHMTMEWHKSKLETFKPTDIITYPSFITFFYEKLKLIGMEFPIPGLERICIGGEPFSEADRKKIEELYSVPVFDVYGCGEIAVTAAECPQSKGTGLMHWYSPSMILEVVDPKTMKSVPNGTTGTMLVTNLWRKSIPIIRYSMGDLLFKSDKKCSCGLNLEMISRFTGRKDDVFQYGAANIYPSQIYEAVAKSGLSDKFQLIVEKSEDLMNDKLTLYVESKETFDETYASATVNKYLSEASVEYNEIVNKIKFRNPMIVVRVEPEKLFHQGMPKLKRIIDKRR